MPNLMPVTIREQIHSNIDADVVKAHTVQQLSL